MIPRSSARPPCRASVALSATPFPVCFVLLSAVLLALLPAPAAAQVDPGPGDWGDAPEGVIAYPSLGVIGLFPTCLGGPAPFVWHGNPGAPVDMYWGPNVDTEIDGNAGICPPPPYEQDECWGPFDGDGGLLAPDTYSINAGLVVPCGQTPPKALGTACQVISVLPGGPFDANIRNNSGLDGFANVLFDWDQSGTWGGGSVCPGGPAPEHAIVNVPVPAGYAGPLSGLYGGSIQIGPKSGHIWIRLNLSEQPVPAGWAGDGIFDLGEAEDYLVRVDPEQDELGEFGDAPEGALAYPSGVIGEFPTCIAVGPAGYVYHAPIDAVYFGPTLDWEFDGNANFCPPPNYDQDECNGGGGDGGILFPMPLTLVVGAIPTTCPNGAVGPDLVGCFVARWGADIDIDVHNHLPDDRLVSVLADWDGDGKWTGAIQVCPNGVGVSERVLMNLVVPGGYNGPLSGLLPPDFVVGTPADGLSWFRFTIHDTPVPANWDGSGNFGDGETEDYLFRIQPPPVDAPELGDASPMRHGLELQGVRPNPMTSETTVKLATDRAGWMTVKVYDPAGRLVATLNDGWRNAGTHAFTWGGRDAANREATPGVYFVRATQTGKAVTAKIVRVE